MLVRRACELVGVTSKAPTIFAVLALGAFATSAAAPSQATVPAGTLIFSRAANENAASDVYVMRNDGSNVRRLARNAEDPAPTRDGREIAFVRRGDIWLNVQRRRQAASPHKQSVARSRSSVVAGCDDDLLLPPAARGLGLG